MEKCQGNGGEIMNFPIVFEISADECNHFEIIF